ncbi:MAG: hypothetical protein ACTHON_09270 [Humibacter sp.]
MSAREALIRSVYGLKNMSQNDMEKLVDAYAHELAEKIRVTARQDIGLDAYELITMDRAADLIDPEVG